MTRTSELIAEWQRPPLVALLGPAIVTNDSGSINVDGKLDRAVLVHLALAEGRAVPVAYLIDALWPEDPPRGARNALQVKISRLRSLLHDQSHRLGFSQDAYRLELDGQDTDFGRFAAGLEHARAALAAGDYSAARMGIEATLSLWRGEPLAEFSNHPRVVAAATRFTELHAAARETHAEARLFDPASRERAIADLRAILVQDPLRPSARRALMEGLDLAGSRAEALAVYDAGRRLLEQTAGLEPSEDLQRTFERMLAAERRASRRATQLEVAAKRAPDGLLETARWLAAEGDLDTGLRLAVRGAWWWWIGGSRGAARALFEELLQRSDTSGADGGAVRLSAEAWFGVFSCHGAQAAVALRSADETLRSAEHTAWSREQALAAALIAERFYERGDHPRAASLLELAVRRYEQQDDHWGKALCALVAARGRLLRGDVIGAERAAAARLADFGKLSDPAGQILALDILGYCAEVRGDLERALNRHHQALGLARRSDAPDWEAAQLTRLGNVEALAGATGALENLEAASTLSMEIGSPAIRALANNGLGVAHQLRGDQAAASSHHLTALSYYAETDSMAGLAYTEARLAIVDAAGGEPALARARDSLRRARTTRDPRAIAHSLEAIAVLIEEPPASARALFAATILRKGANAALPQLQQAPLDRRREEVARMLGRALEELRYRAEADPLGVALELAGDRA